MSRKLAKVADISAHTRAKICREKEHAASNRHRSKLWSETRLAMEDLCIGVLSMGVASAAKNRGVGCSSATVWFAAPTGIEKDLKRRV